MAASSFEERAQAELKRGVLQLAVLALLREPTYGYDLIRILGDNGIPTEEGTLYPILRRLKALELLDSVWDTSGSRPRKYYRTTDKGHEALRDLVGEWSRVNDALQTVLARTSAKDADPTDD